MMLLQHLGLYNVGHHLGTFSIAMLDDSDTAAALRVSSQFQKSRPLILRLGPYFGPDPDPDPDPGALFKSPCDREEEKRAGGIECVIVCKIRTAIVSVKHLPVLKVSYEPLDRCAKR